MNPCEPYEDMYVSLVDFRCPCKFVNSQTHPLRFVFLTLKFGLWSSKSWTTDATMHMSNLSIAWKVELHNPHNFTKYPCHQSDFTKVGFGTWQSYQDTFFRISGHTTGFQGVMTGIFGMLDSWATQWYCTTMLLICSQSNWGKFGVQCRFAKFEVRKIVFTFDLTANRWILVAHGPYPDDAQLRNVHYFSPQISRLEV